MAGGMIYFIWQYFKNKADKVENPPLPDIPNNGVNIPTGYQTTAKSIATQLYDVVTGWFVWSSDKEKAFNVLWNLTDDQLVYVYRVYNSMYFKEYQETMTQAIQNEFYFTNSIKAELVKRLSSLGCV
jgi:hypothetical protein